MIKVLLRYKQLYNKLTHSEAYSKKDGKLIADNISKYNSNFTPHNLRALLISGVGGYMFHYINNAIDAKVDSFTLKNETSPDKVEDWYMDNIKGKSLIDVLDLDKGVKFNGIEEIVIFLGDFTTKDEMNKEYQAVEKFVAEKAQEFSRLERIIVVDDSFLNFVNRVGQMDSAGIQFSSINDKDFEDTDTLTRQLKRYFDEIQKNQGYSFNCKLFSFKRSRRYYGLIPVSFLNSKNYEMDSPYEPVKDNQSERGKPKYALSRYFYELEQAAIEKFEKDKKAKEEADQAKAEAARKAKEAQEKAEAKKNESRKKQRAEMKDFAKGLMKTFTDNMLGVLSQLYSIGFNGMSPKGILCKNGEESPIIYYKGKDIMRRRKDNGTINDILLLKSILEAYPQLGLLYRDPNRLIPPIEDMVNSNPYVLYKLHMILQAADVNCTTRNDLIAIRTWVTETTEYTNAEDWIKENCKNNKLKRWADVKKWYKWVIENIFADCLIDYGVKPIMDEENITKIQKVGKALSSNLKNIIVISDRDDKKFSMTEVRMSANINLDSKRIIEKITDNMNGMFESGKDVVKVSEIGENENNVKVIQVVYNQEVFNKSTLFAGDIIDSIIDSGNTPSWNHALIGKKKDGSPLFWDGFMSPKTDTYNRCYTIYASMGAGKGIMTSTLIASALSDNRQVFYTDGKPENGATMGMVSWKRGKEAYVFDGKAQGSVPFVGSMESYTNGLRTAGEVEKYMNSLPACLFENYFTETQRFDFLGLMRYLRSMSLCFDIIMHRAKNLLPMDNWQIWIFDELTSMSMKEQEIRKLFYKYCDDRLKGGIKANSDGTLNDLKHISRDLLNPGNPKYDIGIDYINNWLNWAEKIVINAKQAAVVELRKAKANIIFIFQEPSWLYDGHGRFTAIGRSLLDLKSMKIVGRGGISSACKQYGDDTFKKAKWYGEINDGTGHWAISQGTSITMEGMTVFKPYSIYTIPIDENQMMTNEPTTDEEKVKYFDGYITKLFGNSEIGPEDVLQAAYTYADEAVKKMGLSSEGLKDYIYDCTFSNRVDLELTSLDIDTLVEEDSFEDKLQQAINGYDPDYQIIIFRIEGDIGTLLQIKRDRKTIGKFEKLKNDYINNFEGVYKKKKLEFIAKIEKEVADKELQKAIVQHYLGRFDIDFNNEKEKIKKLEFDDGVEVEKSDFVSQTTSASIPHLDLDGVQGGNGNTYINIDAEDVPFAPTPKPTPPSDDGFDFDSDPIPTPTPIPTPIPNRPQRPQRPSAQASDQQQGQRPINQRPQNTKDDDTLTYRGRIQVKENPFDRYSPDSNTSVLLSTKDFSRILMDDIQRNIAPPMMIKTFEISEYGVLCFNGIDYKPQFDNSFTQTLPLSIQDDLKNGCLADYFDLRQIYKFKNLDVFALMDMFLAQGRARKEMGIGFRKKWSVLFKKFKHLSKIMIGEKIVYFRENPDEDGERRFLDLFQRNPASTYSQKPAGAKGYSRMDSVWDSRPVRAVTKALGWTIGVRSVWLAASLFGPWGMLFGALAAYGMVRETQKRKEYYTETVQISDGSNGNSGNSKPSQQKKGGKQPKK